jgi:hypothetical protein
MRGTHAESTLRRASSPTGHHYRAVVRVRHRKSRSLGESSEKQPLAARIEMLNDDKAAPHSAGKRANSSSQAASRSPAEEATATIGDPLLLTRPRVHAVRRGTVNHRALIGAAWSRLAVFLDYVTFRRNSACTLGAVGTKGTYELRRPVLTWRMLAQTETGPPQPVPVRSRNEVTARSMSGSILVGLRK